MTPLVVFTIGHSTRTLKDFIRLLKAHGVQRLVDVRTIPRSRHNPQFARDQLSPALHRARIHYRHMPGLGGLRHARRDSVNVGWRNVSFRGYADYMQTAAFEESLASCITLAKRERVVLMCAEAPVYLFQLGGFDDAASSQRSFRARVWALRYRRRAALAVSVVGSFRSATTRSPLWNAAPPKLARTPRKGEPLF